jgi:hypothetical protein
MSHELSWEDLADELEKIRALGPLQATWLAYEGSEDHGIWLLRPHGPELEERRASFSLFAACAIRKCGIPPVPVPRALQYCPHWKTLCASEEEFARLAGKSLDFSDAVPLGLGTIDLDAVDPCTRAWLELLRHESRAFRISSYGTETIKGTRYPNVSGTIDDVCAASAAYVKRRARDEIGSRLIKSAGQGDLQPYGTASGPSALASTSGADLVKAAEPLKKRGRRPSEERRAAIHAEIMKYGGGWRDHLGEIFKELDREEISLGNFYGKRIDLGDSALTSVATWGDLDLAQGDERRQIVDVLRKYAEPRI